MPKATFEGDDAADALAIAICHAHNRGAHGCGWRRLPVDLFLTCSRVGNK